MSMLHTAKQHNATLVGIYARNNIQELDTYPRRIQIIPTIKCNYRCVMCFQSHEEHKKGGEIDFAIFEKLNHVFPFVHQVYFTGGEPLMYSEMPRALEFLGRHGCEISMSTNGAMLTGKRLEMAFRYMHTVKISLDAATPETYARIRKNGNFAKVLSNIGRLSSLKKRHDSPLPHIDLSFVAMRSNIEELPKLVFLAHRYGVRNISVGHLALNGTQVGMEDESLQLHKELSDFHMLKAVNMAAQLGVSLTMPSLFSAEQEASRQELHTSSNFDVGYCDEPWSYLLIDHDGSTGLCCSNAICRDDLNSKSFEEVWNSAQAKRVRRMLNTDHEPPECRDCLTHKRAKDRLVGLNGLGEETPPAQPAGEHAAQVA